MNTIIWIYPISFLVVQIFDTCISFPSRTHEFSTPQLAQCDRPAPVPGNEGLNQFGSFDRAVSVDASGGWRVMVT